MVQTAPSAEWNALLHATSMADPMSVLMPVGIDCQQVVLGVAKGVWLAGRKHDGYLKQITDIATTKGMQVHAEKIKAHVTIHLGMAADTKTRARANDLADESAKAGAAVHRSASTGELALAHSEWKAWVSAAQLAASLLELWPPVAKREDRLRLVRPKPRQAVPKVVPKTQHNFVTMAGQRVCERCLYRAKSDKGERLAMWRECPGAAPRIGGILRSNGYLFRPHVLVLFTAGGKPGLLCTNCGCHASTMQNKLGLSCLLRPARKGAECLSRYRRGLHPHPRQGQQRIEATWKISEHGGIAE